MLEKIIKKYLITALLDVEYLEYYKEKYDDFEFTDLFDYDDIRKNIDNLFLCEKFYDLEYSNDQFEMSENFCTNLIKRFLKLDNYNNVTCDINIQYKSELNRMYLATGKISKLHKYSAEFLNKLISKYHLEDGDDKIAKGKTYQINETKFSHSKDETRNEFLSSEEIFVFCKWNKITLDDTMELLCYSGKNICIPYLKENGFDIETEWDMEYDDETMQKIVDVINEYRKNK